MGNNRVKTNLKHFIKGVPHDISREKVTGKLFIKNTKIEVPTTKVILKQKAKGSYDYTKPSQAQNLGDEWSDYAWSADDF